MKNLPRILQIIWMVIGVVCVFEAYSVFSSSNPDKTSGYLFVAVGIFALIRYITLRRAQFVKNKKDGKYS